MQGDFSENKTVINSPFLYEGFAKWPSFSPDGTKIVFTMDANMKECFLGIIDVSSPDKILPITKPEMEAKRPSWHPHGDKIAYNRNNETIWEYDIPSGVSKLYLSNEVRNNKKLIHPWYSPDGNSILVASYNRNGPQREEVLYRLNPNSDKPIQQLTQYPHVCAGRNSPNPKGSDIIFAGHAGYFNQLENRLWKVDPPAESFPLEVGDSASCHGRCPAYSPFGDWVACVSCRPLRNPNINTPQSIWIIRSDGSEAYRLTDSRYLPSHMSWSPDQKKLAVTGAFGLQLIDLPELFFSN